MHTSTKSDNKGHHESLVADARDEEPMEAHAEAEAVSSFLKVVNDVIRGNESVNPMSERTALKFLIARKFDVERAIQLYQMHEITRSREGLSKIQVDDANLKAEIESGKFTVFTHRDSNNSAIAVFTAKLHSPNKSSRNQASRKKIHRTTLQGIVYQLDAALENITTQRNGIVFIYDMSDSEYSNFDYELCQKILNLLRGAYPAKLKKVLIVSPPLWFRAPFHLLRLIVREKLRDRVSLLNMKQLLDHIPSQALTPELGGTYQHDHMAWIEQCNNIFENSSNDLCDPVSAQNLIKSFSQETSSRLKRPSEESLNDAGYSSPQSSLSSGEQQSTKRQNLSYKYDYDGSGLSFDRFISRIKDLGKEGIALEFDALPSRISGTYTICDENYHKNRYKNVKCFDHTRVVLDDNDLLSNDYMTVSNDYVHANYVDGYRQQKAYISTQGPMIHTVIDFWRMVWQTGCRVIVMVTQEVENGRMKCDKYWPSSSDENMLEEIYRIEYIEAEVQCDYTITHVKLTNSRTKVSRDIWHLQFTSWPDFGTPHSAEALLRFRERVMKKQLDAIELTGSSVYPPIIVHCSAGIGRSGTFLTIDISIQKLETTGLVDIRSIVEKLREQRFGSVQMRDQYVFCYKSVVEYAASNGLLPNYNSDDLFK